MLIIIVSFYADSGGEVLIRAFRPESATAAVVHAVNEGVLGKTVKVYSLDPESAEMKEQRGV